MSKPYTTEEREAIAKARQRYPKTSQRKLAAILNTAPLEGQIGHALIRRTGDSIYHAVRKYDHGGCPRFNPGDRVKVVSSGSRYNQTPGFDNGWMPDMDHSVSRTYPVESQGKDGVRFAGGMYAYPPQVLKLVKAAETVPA